MGKAWGIGLQSLGSTGIGQKFATGPVGPIGSQRAKKKSPRGPHGPKLGPKTNQEGPVGPKWDLSGGFLTVCPPGLYALRGFLCPPRNCMPSRDLYALKGLVCPQGICMPSTDLYALKGLGPHGPRQWAAPIWAQGGPARALGPYGPGPLARPMGPKSLKGIQVP